MITFKSLDIGSSYLDIQYISIDYGLSSYMKVIKVTEAKKAKNLYSHNVKLPSIITQDL